MPKALCIFGLVVAVLLLVLFVLDLAIKVPFGGIGLIASIGFIIVAGVLGYVSWITWREQLK
jgi:hypothetical protein